MKRETTNILRFVLEELIPPLARDSRAMRWLFRRYWGDLIDDLEVFKADIYRISEEEYADIYRRLPRIQNETDNSRACLQAIAGELQGLEILDVGCGTGFLIGHLQQTTHGKHFSGVDIIIDQETKNRYPDVAFHEAKIENLPFEDRSFDTVICTHVLEHVLDIRRAVAELRRVCRQRLIIVVPKEREYQFAFNPHVHYFPYIGSFLRHIIPVPKKVECRLIGRDIFYYEDSAPVVDCTADGEVIRA